MACGTAGGGGGGRLHVVLEPERKTEKRKENREKRKEKREKRN
jgi:hypothetical protein